MNISIILSGGEGSRFESDIPKQYNLLCGKEVIWYSVDALKKSSETDKIIIVCGEKYIEHLSEEYQVTCIAGGKSRNASIKKGLDYISSNYPNCNNVFITEAARPFLTSEIADIYLKSLSEYDAAITACHITDSLGKCGESVTLRDEYYLIQAPEAFRFKLLYDNFSASSDISATVQQLPANRKTLNYFGFRNNLKITYPEDLLIAEQIMKFNNGEIKIEK